MRDKKTEVLYRKYIKKKYTGEDLDMLNERDMDGDSGKAGSEKYKDHEDAA
jgi:hypothetical protein